MKFPLVKLGDICDLFNGYAFKSSDYVDKSNTLSCRMSNIRPGGRFDIGYNPRYLPDDFSEKYDQFKLKDNDVVIAMTDLADSPKILGVPTVIKTNGKNILLNQRVGKLLIKEPSQIYFPYLQLALNSPNVRSIYKKFAGGGLQINLGKKDLLSVQIPLPPLAEQKQIAAILDAADSLRQKDQQLVEHYTALSQSLFSEMFGGLKGEKVPLSSLCKVNPPKSEIAKLDKNMYVSFVPMAKVSEYGEVELTDKRLLEEVWNGFTYFADNDVVFAKITPCMENGKGAIMRNLINGIGFGTTEFHVLRPVQNLSTPEWLYALTVQKSFRQQAELNMTGSAGQKRVPKQFFDKYMVVSPTIEFQNQFAKHVAIIEKQKQQAQTNLQKSEALFNSLLQRAFTGELTADKAA